MTDKFVAVFADDAPDQPGKYILIGDPLDAIGVAKVTTRECRRPKDELLNYQVLNEDVEFDVVNHAEAV